MLLAGFVATSDDDASQRRTRQVSCQRALATQNAAARKNHAGLKQEYLPEKRNRLGGFVPQAFCPVRRWFG